MHFPGFFLTEILASKKPCVTDHVDVMLFWLVCTANESKTIQDWDKSVPVSSLVFMTLLIY